MLLQKDPQPALNPNGHAVAISVHFTITALASSTAFADYLIFGQETKLCDEIDAGRDTGWRLPVKGTSFLSFEIEFFPCISLSCVALTSLTMSTNCSFSIPFREEYHNSIFCCGSFLLFFFSLLRVMTFTYVNNNSGQVCEDRSTQRKLVEELSHTAGGRAPFSENKDRLVNLNSFSDNSIAVEHK